jgi:outer membrane protein OmpA-like peptidoglycan-associated protein
MKKIFAITGIFCLLTSLVSAQFVYDYLKAGDTYFAKADYASAADYYEKYLGKGKGAGREYDPYKPQLSSPKKEAALSSREKAQWQLAESYRLLHYTTKAEVAYKKLLEGNKEKFPLATFHLAEQFRALGRYEEAETEFTGFLKGYTANDMFKATAEREIKNLQFIRRELSKPELKYYTVQPAGQLLSSTGANYAPVWIDTATLWFTSTRPDSSAAVLHHTNRLFQVQYSGGAVSLIQQPGLPQAKGMEQGIATVTADGNTLYFTRWNTTGNKNAALYTSTKQGDAWSEPVRLSASFNQPGVSTQQPFITRDGRYLLFASNKPGGQGGFDIWYAPVDEGGKLGEPVNAGPVVNTADDEQAPYYYDATKTLVFACNGRVGMGGYDLFSSTGSIGNFAIPENLGYPVNSVKDDIYFATRGNASDLLSEVWLSSDRSAACCLELFKLTKALPAPEVKTPPVQEPVIVAVPPAPNTLASGILENVYYAYDKAELLDGSEVSLNKLVAMLNAHKNMVIEIGGHTDGKGSDEYNLKLSQARAQKCVDYIVSKGISASRVVAKGYGAKKPVAPNTNPDGTDNPEGREKNRRTEFTILQR